MYQNELDHLSKSQEKYSSSRFGFLRNITTISVGLLGLLVSLKPEIINLFSAKIAFMFAILSLGIGILFSVISQYHELYINKAEKKLILDNIADKLDGKGTKTVTFIPMPSVFKISEILTYCFLGLSIVSLISYVFLIEFYSILH